MHEPSLSRRAVLAGATLLAAPAIMRQARAAEQCVVGTWGGDYARLLRENIDDPILKPAGVDVVQDIGDENPRVSKLYAQKRLPRGTMDIACVGALNGYRVTEGEVVEMLNETKIPNLKHVLADLRMPAFVPHIYSAQVLVYNPDTVKQPPQTMSDLLDPKWKGKIGMVATAGSWLLQAASLHESGTTTEFDKAKALMLKINGNGLRLYPETDNLAPAFKSGEIEVGMIWLARSFMWRNGGSRSPGSSRRKVRSSMCPAWCCRRTRPTRRPLTRYMNALLQPSAQQGFAAHMGYLPTVEDAPLSGSVGEQLSLPEPKPKLVTPDYPVLSKAAPELNDWWLKNMQHS